MKCPQCTNEMIKAKATSFGEEYDYCRSCKKELKEMAAVQVGNLSFKEIIDAVEDLEKQGLSLPNIAWPPYNQRYYPVPVAPQLQPTTISPPFKVGDIMEYQPIAGTHSSLTPGKQYEVHKCYPYPGSPYFLVDILKDDWGNTLLGVYSGDFKLVSNTASKITIGGGNWTLAGSGHVGFSVGDIITCVDNTNARLTLGKNYKVLALDFRFKPSVVSIDNDIGLVIGYEMTRFKLSISPSTSPSP